MHAFVGNSTTIKFHKRVEFYKWDLESNNSNLCFTTSNPKIGVDQLSRKRECCGHVYDQKPSLPRKGQKERREKNNYGLRVGC